MPGPAARRSPDRVDPTAGAGGSPVRRPRMPRAICRISADNRAGRGGGDLGRIGSRHRRGGAGLSCRAGPAGPRGGHGARAWLEPSLPAGVAFAAMAVKQGALFGPLEAGRKSDGRAVASGAGDILGQLARRGVGPRGWRLMWHRLPQLGRMRREPMRRLPLTAMGRANDGAKWA